MLKTVVGSFDNFSDASGAARDLREAGFMASDINVVANNAGQNAPGVPAAAAHSGDTTSGAATGASPAAQSGEWPASLQV